MKSNSISIISNRRRISLSPEEILYVQLVGRQSVIHISGGRTYETYTTIEDLEQMLGSGFLRADRATLVSAKGIAMKSRLSIPLVYLVLMLTAFQPWYRAHTAFADGIFLALVGCTVLSWIISFIRFVRRELA